MKYIELAVLLAVIQTSAPVPRKAADPSNGTAQTVTKQSGSDKTPAQQAPSIVQSISTQPNQDTSRSPAAENAQKPVVVRELPPVSVTKDRLDKTYIAFTGILIVVGIVGVRAAYKTLGEIKAQREAMQGQLTAMQGQLTAMASSGLQTDKLIEQAKKQTAELKAAADTALMAAQAAVENAKAAKLSADIAAGVALPTLVVEKFVLGNMGNANIMAILQLPKLNIVIRNYGQTPALLHSWSVVLTCEELPAVPAYFGHPGSGLLLDKEVIQPNIPYTLPELPSWNRQQFSLDDVGAIIDRKKMLSVYGYVCYRDLFGSPLKRLKFCEFALNIGDNWIQSCDAADAVYCGTDLYPVTSPKVVVEREPDTETDDLN